MDDTSKVMDAHIRGIKITASWASRQPGPAVPPLVCAAPVTGVGLLPQLLDLRCERCPQVLDLLLQLSDHPGRGLLLLLNGCLILLLLELPFSSLLSRREKW